VGWANVIIGSTIMIRYFLVPSKWESELFYLAPMMNYYIGFIEVTEYSYTPLTLELSQESRTYLRHPLGTSGIKLPGCDH